MEYSSTPSTVQNDKPESQVGAKVSINEYIPEKQSTHHLSKTDILRHFISPSLVEVFVGDGSSHPWVLSQSFLYEKLPLLHRRLQAYYQEHPEIEQDNRSIRMRKVEAPVFGAVLEYVLKTFHLVVLFMK